MKLIVAAVLALVALSHAASLEPEKILRSEFVSNPDSGYSFGFETENGIVRSEQGELKDAVDEENKPTKVVAVRGEYSYKDKDGIFEIIKYFADETGYHAEGDSIPKVPVARR